jgi:hypothetical protein
MHLAPMYGTNRSTVLTHLRRFGVHRRRTKLVASDIVRVAYLYSNGWTIAAIAAELGVGATTVRRALLRAGAEIRPRDRKPICSINLDPRRLSGKHVAEVGGSSPLNWK